MVNQRVSLPLLAGRLVFYAAGQLILCIGIILNTKTGLGVAPINSLPYLASETTVLSLGQATTILYLICILAQCLMRRKIKLSILLQLPFSYLFGWLIDVFNELLDVVQPSNLFWALFWLAIAVVCVALGVTMAVSMDLIANPPDGTVQTISEVFHKDFGLSKNMFDLLMVVLSILGGLIFPHRLIGIGAGTIINALLVGRFAGLFRRKLSGVITTLKSATLRAC